MSQNQLAISNKTVENLAGQLKEKESKGLKFPPNYSVENALNSAYLMLKEAVDKNKKPLLEVCTQESVIQALMQMATQGLNPVKKQCYFVAYGNKCQLLPSYFGTLTVLKRVSNIVGEPVANIIYEGDVFEYSHDVETGEINILKHEQKLENIDNEKIVGAYAIVRTETHKVVEIMSKRQLEKAWGQGQSWQSAERNGYKSKTHTDFTEEMSKKTVLNRACKRLINSSDDSSLMSDEMIGTFNKDTEILESQEGRVITEIAENANTAEFIEEEAVEVVSTQEVQQEKQEDANVGQGQFDDISPGF